MPREERLRVAWQDLQTKVEAVWLDAMDADDDAYADAEQDLEALRRTDPTQARQAYNLVDRLVAVLDKYATGEDEREFAVLRDRMKALRSELDYIVDEFDPKVPKPPGVPPLDRKSWKKQHQDDAPEQGEKGADTEGEDAAAEDDEPYEIEPAAGGPVVGADGRGHPPGGAGAGQFDPAYVAAVSKASDEGEEEGAAPAGDWDEERLQGAYDKTKADLEKPPASPDAPSDDGSSPGAGPKPPRRPDAENAEKDALKVKAKRKPGRRLHGEPAIGEALLTTDELHTAARSSPDYIGPGMVIDEALTERGLPSAMKARDVLRRLLQAGWEIVRQRGSHKILKKAGDTIVFAFRLGKEIGRKMLAKIRKRTGVQLERTAPALRRALVDGDVAGVAGLIAEAARRYTDVEDAWAMPRAGAAKRIHVYVEWAGCYGEADVRIDDDGIIVEGCDGALRWSEGSATQLADMVYRALTVKNCVASRRVWSERRVAPALYELIERVRCGEEIPPRAFAETLLCLSDALVVAERFDGDPESVQLCGGVQSGYSFRWGHGRSIVEAADADLQKSLQVAERVLVPRTQRQQQQQQQQQQPQPGDPDWDEKEHPRGQGGKFARKPQAAQAPAAKPAPASEPAAAAKPAAQPHPAAKDAPGAKPASAKKAVARPDAVAKPATAGDPAAAKAPSAKKAGATKTAAKKAAKAKATKAAKAATRGGAGSQLPAQTLQRLRDLGVTKLPMGDVPLDKVVVHPLDGDDVHSRALLTWRDKAGKMQHGYTQQFHDANAARKWEHVAQLDPEFDQVRGGLRDALQRGNVPEREHQALTIASVIAETGLRPGGEAGSTKRGRFGISTLRAKHIKFDGDVAKLSFVGKSGKRNRTTVRDPANVAALRRYADGKQPDDALFEATRDDAGRALNGIREGTRLKDLRTVIATRLGREAIQAVTPPPPPLPEKETAQKKLFAKAIKGASQRVAERINNTWTMARDSYIHPEVFEAWRRSLGVAGGS